MSSALRASPRLTRLRAAVLVATYGGLLACQRGASGEEVASAAVSASAEASATVTLPSAPPSFGQNSVAKAMPTDKPLLAITSFVGIVYKEPKDTAKRIGYLRVGAKVPRSEEAVSTKGCPGGWYEIAPSGFVCVGKDATLDLEDPVVRAAAKRPNLSAPLPYRYGFVRAVLPLYLGIPSGEEQAKSEFKLKEHLDWYEEKKAEANKMKLGAWDVPVDGRGVPVAGREVGDLGQGQTSLELGLGRLFGGETDDDPPPFWLEGGKRSIPNISDFAVPDTAIFADRARRFTGLAFVGSFATNEASLNRRFAITTDLRLAPTTKLKPDSGSPWHGVELADAGELPLAFVREQGATRTEINGDTATPGAELAWRSVVKLSGKQKKIGGERYYATRDGSYVRGSDMGLVIAPHTWPKAAEDGEKWIEVSLGEQTLVMWEGKRPVYATLISSGREEHPTITGEFRIRNKHITATMDSDEASEVGGAAAKVAQKSGPAAPAGGASDKPKTDKPKTDKKSDKKSSKPKADKPKADKPKAGATKDKKPAAKAGPPAKIPTKGDGEYGVTKRRGEGLYALKDVPYIQYFASGFALHAAYWHDVFGKKRSHGCVNLSPIDAHRVFMWTEPAVPDGWHAINSGEEFGEGTVVIVHE